MSEETDGAGSGPKDNSAGIDPVAVALAMAGASRERMDAHLKDQREPIAAQLHRNLGSTFKSHWVVKRLNFKGGSYV